MCRKYKYLQCDTWQVITEICSKFHCITFCSIWWSVNLLHIYPVVLLLSCLSHPSYGRSEGKLTIPKYEVEHGFIGGTLLFTRINAIFLVCSYIQKAIFVVHDWVLIKKIYIFVGVVASNLEQAYAIKEAKLYDVWTATWRAFQQPQDVCRVLRFWSQST